MKPYLALTGILLLALGNAQADTFRWLDKSGKVHYGDMPAAEATQIEQKKLHSAAGLAEDADLPYIARHARQFFPVTLYVSDDCGTPCQHARDFLSKRGIPFTEKKLAAQEEIDKFKKESSSDQVPALRIGRAWLKNFHAEQWNMELDVAGYPKLAP